MHKNHSISLKILGLFFVAKNQYFWKKFINEN
jgi:hypothetical protein